VLANDNNLEQSRVAGEAGSDQWPIVSEEPDGMDLLGLFRLLNARKRLILAATLAGGLLAGVWAFLLPPKYTAITVIMPPQQQQSSASALLGQLGAIGNLAGRDLGIKNPSDPYMGILSSRTVADELIAKFGLRSVYGVRNLTDVRKKLASATHLDSTEYSLIRISVEDRDPKRAADMANAYVDQLQQQVSRLAVTEAAQRRLFFERQLESEKRKLAEAEADMKRLQEQKGIVQVSSQTEALIRSMAQIRAEIAAREVGLQRLKAGATAQNPEVLRQEIELTALRAQLRSLESRDGKKTPGDPLMTSSTIPEASLDYLRRLRELSYHQSLYELLAKQYEAARIDEAKGAPVIQIVDRAIVPDKKSWPPRAVFAALGVLLGGFFGVVFVVMRERADRSLHEPGDISYYLSLPELGVIPTAENKAGLFLVYRKRLNRLVARKQAKRAAGEAGDGVEEDGASSVELVTWKRKPSALGESFRAALPSILFCGENGSHPRALTIASPEPGEGKTAVVSNLGIALAEVNQRVLMIDGDLRKPRLHEIFEVTRQHGLSDILKDNTPLDGNPLDGSVRATAVENLFLLPSGTKSNGASNLLYSARMSELLELFKKQFDMVLIDTPPMMQIPDARILGRMSDAVILVVRAGKTMRDTALAARQRFAEDGANVLGAILNYWDPKKSAGGSYRYNYYDRYYYRG